MAALRLLRLLAADHGDHAGIQERLARTWLMLGSATQALRHWQAVTLPGSAVGRDNHSALRVRILLRASRFEKALAASTRAVLASKRPTAELLAAHASSLFRMQRTDAAAKVYGQVLKVDANHAEAHLRLGSGLLPPCEAVPSRHVRAAVADLRAGKTQAAVGALHLALQSHPGHPVAHRLLGETLYQQQQHNSFASRSALFAKLRQLRPRPRLDPLLVSQFIPGYRQLSASRRRVADQALGLFSSRLRRLLAMGGRHDLLAATERTTDAAVRRPLRGTRTFDGRVWDDVRGIGGIQAATGIEALDEAWHYGFDTLAHEVAHQAHLYAFRPVHRLKVRKLYQDAKRAGRCLDFYAASNEAEYFAQGVEAFMSLAKRPGCQKTHGHTRFELYRVDRPLYQLIARLVDHDPLADEASRSLLLPLAARLALQCGRPADARVAATMMQEGEERQMLLRQAAELQGWLAKD